MILTARMALVLSAALVLGLANYMTVNENNITNFMVDSAFAQTDPSVDNSTDPYAVPQDNSTNPYAIPQDNSTDPNAIPQYTTTDPYATTQDNSSALTDIQNQTSSVSTPEFGPVSILVLTIGLISIILVSMRSKFSLNIK